MKLKPLKIFDLYFIKIFLSFFAICYLAFICFYFIGNFVGDPLYLRSRFLTVLKYHTYLLIPYLPLLMPPTILLASLFSFSTLSKHLELLAVQAGGISPYRFFALLSCIAIIAGTGVLIISDRMVEKYYKKALYIRQVEIKNMKNFSYLRTNKIWYRSENTIYDIDSFDPYNNIFYGLTLYILNKDFELEKKIMAKKCVFENNQWVAFDVSEVSILKEERFPTPIFFKDKPLTITEKPDDFKIVSRLNYGFFSIKELKDIIKKHKKLGTPTRYYETQLHSKFSLLFTILLMIYLGIPFAFTGFKKINYIYDVITCIGVTFVFWFINSFFTSLGNADSLPPFLAAWSANIIFFAIGIEIFRRKRELWQF